MDDSAQVAFHKGDFVVVAAPPPDAFWLAQALSDVDSMYSAGAPASSGEVGTCTGNNTTSSNNNNGNVPGGETRGLFTPVRFLERVASFENGDDLYRSWKEAKVQLRDGRDAAGAGVAAGPRQFVLPLAERHRIVAFLASTFGADTPAEAVLADGLGVAALVSSAAFDRAAFLLVKWAGLECAMTWEPRALLAAACPELLEHYENAPYKPPISYPPPPPPPILDAVDVTAAAGAANGAGAAAGDTEAAPRGGRRSSTHVGRGRGAGKTRGARGARLSHSAVVAAVTEALGPVPPPPQPQVQLQPQPMQQSEPVPKPDTGTTAPSADAAT